MDCPVCNHEEHNASQCKQCNCGQSEIIQPLDKPSYGPEVEYGDYLLNIRRALNRGALQPIRSYKIDAL